MTKQELKPCPNPWCRFEGTATVESMTRGPARVVCRCGVRTPDVGGGQGEKEAEKLAIATWNARPADPLTKARVREAFDKIAAVNTVTICSLDEMEAIVNRALNGEFDGDFAKVVNIQAAKEATR